VRILQVIQKIQLRGAENFAAQLSMHMEAQGHEVCMVALLDGTDGLPYTGKIQVLHARLAHRFWDRSAWKRLADIIRTFKPDMVQANSGDTLKYCVLSKTVFSWEAPIVFRNASVMSRYLKGGVTKSINRWLLSKVDHIISVSEASRDDLQSLFSIPSSRFSVLPVGIERVVYGQVASMAEPGPHLVHVGGFSFEKNHTGLLRIFQSVRAHFSQAQLWLVGDGPLRVSITDMVNQQPWAEAVHFTGFIRTPLDYIASGDVLLLPSVIEGFPAVIPEAFYCGTPVVAYEVGGIGSILTAGQTGFPIKPNDENAFADAVIRVLQMNEDQRRSITDRARNLVESTYLNEQIADAFIRVYQQITPSTP
jgi:glycosyltransferase involved in cell wall biosynthesis